MIALLFALFCAVSLNFVGALDQTTDMAVGILLVWGIAVFFLPRPTLTGWRLLVAAALVRLTLLPIDAGEFSDYSTLLAHASVLWDGGNPYSGASPSSFSPLKLWLFAPFADLQPWIPRLATVGMDVLLVSILVRFLSSRSRRTDIAWIYALHPLGAVESAVHGNLDALMLCCAVGATLAWGAKKSGQGWASLGSLVNALPLVILPTLWKRGRWILGLAAIFALIIVWPISDAGFGIWTGIGRGITENALPGLLPMITSWMNPTVMYGVCGLMGVVSLGLVWRRWKDPIDVLHWSAASWIILAATIHPAAILWVWVPSLLCGVRSWSVLATLAPLAYLCLDSVEFDVLGPSSKEWIPWLVFLPFLTSFVAEFLRHQIRPGPWQVGPAETTLPSPSPT